MLHFFRFNGEVQRPVPAREIYEKPGKGRGWPVECPPLRAANALGWDVLASHDMTFRQHRDGTWEHRDPVDVTSDWTWSPSEMLPSAHGGMPHSAGEVQGHAGEHEHENDPEDEGVPLVQRNAWFWEKGQTLPHPISDDVYEQIKHQVKVSTFLYLHTDPNELLLITDVPNLARPFRALSALVETDWYPASYPWHCVLELDRREKEIVIEQGTPLCRLLTVRRDTYFAHEMDEEAFARFFERGQAWLAANAKGEPGPMMDITGRYGRHQIRSRFVVLP